MNLFFFKLLFKLKASVFDYIINIILIFFKKKIYFGKLNNKGKISHLISYVEPIARKKIIKNNLLVILNPGDNANSFLVKKYKDKYIYISYRDKFYKIINCIFMFFIKNGKYDLKFEDFRDEESTKVWSYSPPSIKFNDEEEEYGKDLLNKMNLKKNLYICFGLRDPEFYKDRSIHIEVDAGSNSFHRNPNPKNYIKFINYFCTKGIKVCRIGKKVSYNFDEIKSKNFFDYSRSNYQSDFMDFYIQKNAKFVLSGGAGLWTIANLFNVPVVLTDSYMLYGSKRYQDLFLPKLLFNKKQNRYLTFKEMIQIGQRYLFEDNCVADEVYFRDSDENEILEVAKEMNDKLDNKNYKKDWEIKSLHDNFLSLLPVNTIKYFREEEFFYPKHVKFAANISSRFIVKFKNLL